MTQLQSVERDEGRTPAKQRDPGHMELPQKSRGMNVDPVISTRYGMRPLLDVPALDVSGDRAALKTADMVTMAPPPLNRSDPEGQQGTDPPARVPNDWPYAAGLPGSLFAAPPGPMPFKNPQAFPYSFLHAFPYAAPLQRPPYHITDSTGQPVHTMDTRPEQQQQQLSYLYPGVHNPYLPQGFFYPYGGFPRGIVPQAPQIPTESTPKADGGGRIRFEGMLIYGSLSSVNDQEKSNAFRSLPEFLRHELYRTYGHVPATEVRIEELNEEFHVYASPRTLGGNEAGEDLSQDHRLIV